MPTTLITGVNGFTGRYLAPVLSRRGHRVCGLVRDPISDEIEDVAQVYAGDLADPGEIKRIVADIDPDHVIHLAAVAFVAHGDVYEMYRSNIFGTRCLLESCRQLTNLPRSILVVSSANIYGNSAEGMLSETAPMLPANDYGITKVAVEHLTRIYMKSLPIIVTRPFNYTGRGQSTSFLVPKIVDAIRNKRSSIKLGNLDIWRDFSDVRSLAEDYARLIETPTAIGQVFNISSGRTIGLRQILNDAMRLGGHELDVEIDPMLVRSNEIRSLCGDSRKLESIIGRRRNIPFEATLGWMLGF